MSWAKQHTSLPLVVPEPTAQDTMVPTGIYPGPQDVDETGTDSSIVAEIFAHQEDKRSLSTKVSPKTLAGKYVLVHDTLIPRMCHRFKRMHAEHVILSKRSW